MSTRHENADGPEDIDAAFAEIVAGLEQDEPMARWPEEQDRSTEDASPKPAAPEAASAPRDWTPPADAPDEGHYEPPEPPPMPRPGVATVGGILLVVLGMTLLLVPGLVGLGATAALPIGLVAVSGGIGWLLFRMRRTPPADPTDDGAQL
ncbi:MULTISPECIES: DUF308 domain-containing protein [unclassified Saccharopolyspora]|uniref:DUF308 domain-containing protein n=1 Tax=unclassified Saccharopolyspora TaxID=2646250 RepID=UPI001CD252F2|nr:MULTISPECIES: DUF308 domain-containing protein [unclassified Saccharopolyspora]MCA1187407.1 DUF308 domain-containing protein [Saccharopolyspora sp. 6T]MCA1192480.1 DUF308 domain-containing protein [Saccharopolyspora sp. 6V]MCA1281358.1 DUF308 domain-containing protein [Saccharopolyspora sp. 7B]